MIAAQDLIIFGKFFKKGEIISNNINGKIYTKEQIIAKLKEKNYRFIDKDEEIKENKGKENKIEKMEYNEDKIKRKKER
ncbi:MAG: hypothetical protein GYA14_13840 [Ignavibacteria bacterium]|nr:hypothetical protein [Ignavibacteria bacterium]